MGVGGGLRPGHNFSWILLKRCYEWKMTVVILGIKSY